MAIMQVSVECVTPKDIRRIRREYPMFATKAFNELIEENAIVTPNGISSRFTRQEAIDRMLKLGALTKEQIIDNDYLDVKETYKSVGWGLYEENDYYAFHSK